MNAFWEESWEKIDKERLMQYINDFDSEPDELITYLRDQQVKTVCDAGCGCGIYALKLISNGFAVSGFDISAHAVQIARELLNKASVTAELKAASVLSTGYPENWFDGVVSRDVIDHMQKKDAIAAVRELYRITKPGGVLLFTLDGLDREYEEEAHTVNGDGDFLFADGKWDGMVFHPYTAQEAAQLIPSGAKWQWENCEDGILVKVRKQMHSVQG